MVFSQILKSCRSKPSKNYKSWQRFSKNLDFKYIKFPVKVRDIQKIKKQNSTGINILGYENKEKQPIYVSKKCCEEKHVDLLLIEEIGKTHYVLITVEKTFCRYCLQDFSKEEILECHIKDSFKINGKQKTIMPKKGEYVKLKKYERKIKSPFIIYADFERSLGSEDNGKQNPEESYINKHQKHIACSYWL